MSEHKLRFFSTSDDGAKEVVFPSSGFFFGHVTEILTPQEFEERERYGDIGGHGLFGINNPGIVAYGYTIWTDKSRSSGGFMKATFDYEQIAKCPALKIGDKVKSNISLSEKGEMKIISVYFEK